MVRADSRWLVYEMTEIGMPLTNGLTRIGSFEVYKVDKVMIWDDGRLYKTKVSWWFVEHLNKFPSSNETQSCIFFFAKTQSRHIRVLASQVLPVGFGTMPNTDPHFWAPSDFDGSTDLSDNLDCRCRLGDYATYLNSG